MFDSNINVRLEDLELGAMFSISLTLAVKEGMRRVRGILTVSRCIVASVDVLMIAGFSLFGSPMTLWVLGSAR